MLDQARVRPRPWRYRERPPGPILKVVMLFSVNPGSAAHAAALTSLTRKADIVHPRVTLRKRRCRWFHTPEGR